MDEVAIIHRTASAESLPWLPRLHTPAEDKAFFRDRVFKSCEVWGWVDAEIAGFIAFRTGWVDHLFVLPEHQGKGAGKALLGIAKASQPVLRLWTFQRNARARRFYEKHGFVAIRQTDGSDNEEREPDVLYHWER
jgi:GNAT superfamily N-acetyltransferase